jgi:opacity protein-like surface antigen
MTFPLKAGLAAASLALAAALSPASAADLGYGKGSLKDGYVPVAPVQAAGPCYFRSDIGYSWSSAPTATYVGNAADPNVRGEQLGNGGFIEAGLGCGMGSRGFRGELVLGVREKRKFSGDVDIDLGNVVIDPPIHTEIKSYTMMFNGYYDLGRFGGFVPYVGAGIGWAYHTMHDVIMDHPLSPNPQFGEDKLSFAWSLMAGVGYQLTDRAILDVGYRYIDMGLARSSHADSAGAWNPRLEVDDLRAHEFKVGLRYHFGSDCCAQPAYVPMK